MWNIETKYIELPKYCIFGDIKATELEQHDLIMIVRIHEYNNSPWSLDKCL